MENIDLKLDVREIVSVTLDGIDALEAVKLAKFIRERAVAPSHVGLIEIAQRLLDEDADEIMALNERVVWLEDLLRTAIEFIESTCDLTHEKDIYHILDITPNEYIGLMERGEP